MIRTTIIMLTILAVTGCEKLEAPPLNLVGTLERDRIEIIAESNDPLITFAYTEGEHINAGDMVAQQDPALYQTRLEQLLATRDRLRFRLAELERGPRPEVITAARAKLAGFSNEIKIQQREYQRVSRLLEQQLATPSALDKILEIQEKAEANRDQAKAELDALLAGTTGEELDQARAALAEAEAVVTTQQLLLDRLRLASPVDGTLDRLYYETGERPVPGLTVAVILGGPPYARVYIPETVRSKIHTGQPAEIRIDGMDTLYQGRIRYVSSDAAFTPYYALTQRERGRLSYLAEIDLTGSASNGLPNGVPLEVSFPGLNAASGD